MLSPTKEFFGWIKRDLEPNRRVTRIAIVLLLVFTVVVGVRAFALKEVTIYPEDGEPITLTTAALRVSSVLAQSGIELKDGDVVVPAPEVPVRHGDVISIRRAFSVTIHSDGQQVEVKTVGDTVGQILAAAGIELGESDRTVPAVFDRIQEPTSIEVIRVEHSSLRAIMPVAYKTEKRSDPNLDQGKKRTAQAGVNGSQEVNYRLTYENGKLTAKEEVGRTVLVEPVTQIVYEGSRVVPNTVKTSSGTYLKYKEVKTMQATAYVPGSPGITATGVKAKKGIIAVDPKVIPLGTKVYIPGYGEAIAADTGRLIKGNIVDLCLPTYSEAITFGRKTVKVYILVD
jgi:uncharacterized protein YabE (DUF348 family)